ncbi:MAG TPA: amino acid permease [Bryobacteraceae bacterium]|nr:amino acid permease [Bryobacteraceae bacterium]
MNEPAPPRLVRAIGLFSLMAMAVNGMVGAGIFVLPAQVAGILGPAALSAYVVAGFAVGLIVLCFAEVGTLFERSGGPYLYARAAFGNWIGFEIGWMLLLSRLTAVGAISNAFASYLGFFWPPAAAGGGRILVITVSVGLLGAVNYFGVRYGAWVSNLFTVSKLVPLTVFIIAGLFWLNGHARPAWTLPPLAGLQQAGLLLIFAFGGFEFAVVPGEEVINLKKNLPIALLTGIALVAVLYVLIQFVAEGALPGLASSRTPLADASVRFLGPLGGVLLALGAVLSTTGTNSGTMLMGPRIIYAMAEGGQLPAVFARVHPSYRTPHVAVVVATLMGWLCAMSGEFAVLAALSAIARLLSYMATCAALPVLRRKMPGAQRGFTVPGGAIIPIAAVALSGWLLLGSTRAQVTISAAALLIGAAIFGGYQFMMRLQLQHETTPARPFAAGDRVGRDRRSESD